MTQTTTDYAFRTQLALPYGQAVERATAALKENVIVYEEDSGSAVSIVDTLSMLGVAEGPALDPATSEARARLQRVSEGLGS